MIVTGASSCVAHAPTGSSSFDGAGRPAEEAARDRGRRRGTVERVGPARGLVATPGPYGRVVEHVVQHVAPFLAGRDRLDDDERRDDTLDRGAATIGITLATPR